MFGQRFDSAQLHPSGLSLKVRFFYGRLGVTFLLKLVMTTYFQEIGRLKSRDEKQLDKGFLIKTCEKE